MKLSYFHDRIQASTMKWASAACLALVSLGFVTGCYTTFGGFYRIPQSEKSRFSTRLTNLPDQLEVALRPFGMKRYDYRYPENGKLFGVEFAKARGAAPFRASKLAGSDANVGVYVDLTTPSKPVTIGDAAHRSETEFDRAVMKAIVDVFKKQYGVTPRFERVRFT